MGQGGGKRLQGEYGRVQRRWGVGQGSRVGSSCGDSPNPY